MQRPLVQQASPYFYNRKRQKWSTSPERQTGQEPHSRSKKNITRVFFNTFSNTQMIATKDSAAPPNQSATNILNVILHPQTTIYSSTETSNTSNLCKNSRAEGPILLNVDITTVTPLKTCV